jgi:general secretion pathway protein D
MNRIGPLAVGVLAGLLIILAGCAADRLHQKGLTDLDKGDYETGVSELRQAAASDPQNMTYRLDVAARRDAAVQKLIAQADAARAGGDLDGAAAIYKRVLSLDPNNGRALHGLDGIEADRRHAVITAAARSDFEHKDFDAAEAKLRSVVNEDPTYTPALQLSDKINAARGPVSAAPRLKPANNAKVTLEFRDAPTKMVFEVLSRQTGINFVIDKDVKSDGKTTIFVHEVPIEEAIDLVLDQNGLARQILSNNMVLIYPNTAAKQKDYQEQIVRTFYISNAAPKDVEGLLKSVLGAKTLYIDERSGVVVMRDTPEAVRMAEKLVASIDVPEPEVMMEVEVLEISRSALQNLGISYPSSVTATLNPVTNASGLVLSDLRKQNENTVGISALSATLNALRTKGLTNTLASPRIRARNKEKAKILIGSRVPVITNTVTPTTSSAVVTGSVQYLDVGLTLNVQPTVYDDGDVAIKIGMEVSSITNQITTASGTIAYTIGTRNADTLLRLKDGETQILAGLIQDSDTRSASGIPGFSDIPILGRLFGSNNTDREKSEIVLSITPRIIRAPARAASDATEFWYGTESRMRSTPLGMTSSDSSAAPAATSRSSGVGGAGPSGEISLGNTGASSGLPATSTGVSAASSNVAAVAVNGSAPRPTARELAATMAAAAAASGPAPHPVVTIDGPSETSVGQEFDVTVRLASDQGITHLRSQLRFDAGALQLLSANAGDIVPASAGTPTVDQKASGVQLDVSSTDDPIQGEGSIMVLRFKALAARGASPLAAQVSAVSGAGTAAANAMGSLSLAIKAK